MADKSFANGRNNALVGIATDGVNATKHSKLSSWPILGFVLNARAEFRNNASNILLLG